MATCEEEYKYVFPFMCVYYVDTLANKKHRQGKKKLEKVLERKRERKKGKEMARCIRCQGHDNMLVG